MEKRRRLLFIQNYWTPYRNDLFNRLSTDFDLSVIYLSGIVDGRKWKREDVQYRSKELACRKVGPFYFSEVSEEDVTGVDVIILIDNLPNFWSVLKIKRIAEKERIPIIVWSGESLDRRYTSTFYGFGINALKRTFERKLFWGAKAFWAYSSKTKAMFETFGIRPESIFIIPQAIAIKYNGINTETGENRPVRVLYVGYLREEKNLELLIDAFNELSNENLELVILGDGECREELQKRSTGRIIFKGYHSGEEKYGEYVNSDILVLPSTREPWGFVVNEAMYFGLPVLCSSVAGACDALDGNGYVFDPHNKEVLKSLLLKLAGQPALRTAMGRRSKELYNNYTIEKAAEVVAGSIRAVL